MMKEDALTPKVFSMAESELDEDGIGYHLLNDITESLRPFDYSVSGLRISNILRRLGISKRRRTAQGVRYYIDTAIIAEAKKRINGGEK
jgi:hypothetical protein